MKVLLWVTTVMVSAYACHVSVQHATPVDQALPLIAVVIAMIAAASHAEVMLGVPLLIVAEVVVQNEHLRLLAFGVIVAAVFGVACIGWERRRNRDSTSPTRLLLSLALTAGAVVLLRWIPLEDVFIGRELFLIAVAIAIVMVLRSTPFAVAVAVVAVLITPAVPLRTLGLPVLVLVVCLLARFFGMPRFAFVWPSAVVLAFVMLFFAWSGVVARAFPWLLRPVTASAERAAIGRVVAAGESILVDVPPTARSLVMSGANVPRLRRGTLLGRLDPGGIPLRIGDMADWGYMRREHYYGSRNPLPRDPAGLIRDYGYAAWVDGAGRVLLPPGVSRIRITAASTLPPGAAIQLEAFELESP